MCDGVNYGEDLCGPAWHLYAATGAFSVVEWRYYICVFHRNINIWTSLNLVLQIAVSSTLFPSSCLCIRHGWGASTAQYDSDPFLLNPKIRLWSHFVLLSHWPQRCMGCSADRDGIYPEQKGNGTRKKRMRMEKDRGWSAMVKKDRNLVSKKEVGVWGRKAD